MEFKCLNSLLAGMWRDPSWKWKKYKWATGSRFLFGWQILTRIKKTLMLKIALFKINWGPTSFSNPTILMFTTGLRNPFLSHLNARFLNFNRYSVMNLHGIPALKVVIIIWPKMISATYIFPIARFTNAWLKIIILLIEENNNAENEINL